MPKIPCTKLTIQRYPFTHVDLKRENIFIDSNPSRRSEEQEYAYMAQLRQLERWSNILTPCAFQTLKNECSRLNQIATDAFEVPRGDKLITIVKLIKDGFI